MHFEPKSNTPSQPQPRRRRIVAARESPGLPLTEASTPERIATAIRAGRWPNDTQFDTFLPDEVRRASGKYWTQLCVAARIAGWLDELELRSVVDIGSGSGKFCVATALAARAHFTGIEQRWPLVAAARELALRFGVTDRVVFERGTFPDVEVPVADAYYSYNPFGENRLDWRERLDNDVELSDERYRRDVAAMTELLRRSPIGTCLIAYNGFGGKMPAGYRRIRSDENLPSMLGLWRRVR